MADVRCNLHKPRIYYNLESVLRECVGERGENEHKYRKNNRREINVGN
jgi:hypothetical protein